MKKDIKIDKVEDVGIAAVKEQDDLWSMHLVNLKDIPLDDAIIAISGSGNVDGEKKKTSSTRHFFKVIPAKKSVPIESITSNIVGFTHTYWLSFYIDGKIFDKKFVFLPDSIKEENATRIAEINKTGVLII